MDQRDEFSKWMTSIEQALTEESTVVDEELLEQGSCGGCGAWDCPECFPDADGALDGAQQIPAVIIIGATPDAQGQSVGQPPAPTEEPPAQPQGVGMAGTHPVDGDTFDHDEEDEIDVTMMGQDAFAEEDEDDMEMTQQPLPRSGNGGVTLGHIVQKFVKAGGGEEGSEEELSEDDGDASEMIGKIMYMQDMGLSNGQHNYNEAQLGALPPEQLKLIHDEVTGNVSENSSKPTKPQTKPNNWDGLDDILNPTPDQPIANYDNTDDGEHNDTMPDPEATPSMPRASAASTRAKTQGMTPSDTMRDFMGRINPEAGAGEPDIEPEDTTNALVARTAADVPAVISAAMRVAGVEMPEWHSVNNLPGFSQSNVRGMGRKVFSMFTSTPLEQIQTIANVDGQGPNTDAELRSVASWLMNNADDLGEVKLDHGAAIPGYKPDVKEYSINGVRFHVVRDPMGQYIYAYPDADAKTNTGAGRLGQGQQPPQGAMPRIREGKDMAFRLTITEAIKLDDIIREGLASLIFESEVVDESSLSKVLGKNKGGQQLVRFLHSKHKLSNEAQLEPVKFNKDLLWSQFKSHPDDFVIVSGANGAAGIKPSKKHFDDYVKAKQDKGQTPNPGRNSSLQYQIVAFTDDGERVDPELLRVQPEPGDEPVQRDVDPTVMRARMGKNIGSDLQNANNTFRLLNDQIGPITTVWISGFGGYRGDPDSVKPAVGSVERDKMKARDELGAGPGRQKDQKPMPERESVNAVFKMIRPVLKKLTAEAMSPLMNARKRAIDADNEDQVERLTARIKKMKNFLEQIDTSADVDINSSSFGPSLRLALATAAGARSGSEEYKQYLSAAARGSRAALKPVLDALRDEFFAKLG